MTYVRCIKAFNHQGYNPDEFGIVGSVYRVHPNSPTDGSFPNYFLLVELVGYQNCERFEPVVIVKDSL